MVRNILTPTLAGGLSEDHLFLIRLFLSFFDLDRPKIYRKMHEDRFYGHHKDQPLSWGLQ